MASVHIYKEHQDILNGLITSNKVGSTLGATETGPFKENRDAYVFAASIGLALGSPTPVDQMPKSKAKGLAIRDSVFLGSKGAEELSLTVTLVQELNMDDDAETALKEQLETLTDGDHTARFAILDRYAHAGFAWLDSYQGDTASIRDLVLEAIDTVAGTDYDPEDFLGASDPLGSFLLA